MTRRYSPLLALSAGFPALGSMPAVAASGGVPETASVAGAGGVLAGIAAVLLLAVIGGAFCRRIARAATARLDRRRIEKILREEAADRIGDFMLPGAYGGLTHIDYSVLTPNGIFCIQTKFCDGIVSGAPDEPQWTNVDGSRHRRFLNPLIQNEGRTRALRNVATDVPVANVVVFRDTVRFSSPMAGNVVRLRDLKNFMASYEFQPCDGKKLDAVWRELRSAALTDEASRKDFNAQLSFS